MNNSAKVIVALLIGLVGGYFIGSWRAQSPVGDDLIVNEEADSVEVGSNLDDIDTNISTDDSSEATRSGDEMNATSPSPITNPSNMTTGENKIVVTDQSAGSVVAVTLVTLTERGWVVVYEDNNGALGNILGAKRLEAGTNLPPVTLLRNTVPSMKYYVVLHSDNGNGTFDYISSKRTADLPLADENGMPIMATFSTTAEINS